MSSARTLRQFCGRTARPVTIAALACGIVLGPFAAGFANAQDGASVGDLRQQREDNRRQAADVAAELDVLSAQDDELAEAIAALDAHISLQESHVAAAEDLIADAEDRAAAARGEAAALGDDMETIRDRLRLRAVDVFVSPRLDVLEQLNSDDLLESELKKSYVDEWIGDEKQIIDQLRTAEAAQVVAERVAQEALDEAEAERGRLAERLAELDVSRTEVEGLRAEITDRIDEWQAVGNEIDAADAALEQQIRDLEAEEARKAEEARTLEEARRAEEARKAEEERRAVEAGEEPAADDADEPVSAPVALGPFRVTHRPVPGSITSPFGSRVHPVFGSVRNHYGADFNARSGDPIVAAASGVVLSAGWRNGYGWAVVISHGDGFTTLYAHQSEMLVSAGQSVSGGDVIGRVGSTGYSTGPHLHFEIRINGAAVDPAPYL